jgi:hypothetical protein
MTVTESVTYLLFDTGHGCHGPLQMEAVGMEHTTGRLKGSLPRVGAARSWCIRFTTKSVQFHAVYGRLTIWHSVTLCFNLIATDGPIPEVHPISTIHFNAGWDDHVAMAVSFCCGVQYNVFAFIGKAPDAPEIVDHS